MKAPSRSLSLSFSFLRSAVGAALLWGSAGAAGYAIAWTVRSHEAGGAVAVRGQAQLHSSSAFDASTACRAGDPSTGQLAGMIEVPSLSLSAPVEQGDTGAVLSDSVGHDPSSVWPGSDGTAVLAAHDVSYFALIGTLRPGAILTYVSPCTTVTFKVTGHRIVPSGSPVANSAAPTLVLDTCWPNDALWWTPDRELVSATEVSSRPRVSRRVLTRAGRPAGAPLGVPVPPALAGQGLTLDTNPTLLGTMTVSGRPSVGFVQSPEPLDVEQAALTAYYATLHAVAGDRPGWFAAVAPGVAFPTSIAGGSITEYLTRLTVNVEASGSRPIGAVLAAEVAFRSPDDTVSDLSLVVAAVVRRGELLVSRWSAAPGAPQ